MIPQYEPKIRTDLYLEYVADTFKSGWIGPAKETEKFESGLARVTGWDTAIATTSGTTSLMLALAALEVPEGARVLFPAYTFIAGANAARVLGFEVVLVDVDPQTLCMDPNDLEDKIWFGDVVIFVNHNGFNSSDVHEDIKEICEDRHAYLIQDTAQCIGMEIPKIDQYGILSFSVPKLITTGQGGAVLTDSVALSTRVKNLLDQGGGNWRKDGIHQSTGANFKFNDILAAVGNAQLNILPTLLAERAYLFNQYRRWIPLVDFGLESTWMVIYRAKNASKVVEHLKSEGVQACQYYRPINHNPPFYSSATNYPGAEQLYKELVYLPSSLTLTAAEIASISHLVDVVGQDE